MGSGATGGRGYRGRQQMSRNPSFRSGETAPRRSSNAWMPTSRPASSPPQSPFGGRRPMQNMNSNKINRNTPDGSGSWPGQAPWIPQGPPQPGPPPQPGTTSGQRRTRPAARGPMRARQGSTPYTGGQNLLGWGGKGRAPRGGRFSGMRGRRPGRSRRGYRAPSGGGNSGHNTF